MKNKLITAVFLVMLAVFAALLFLPADEQSIEAENRTMTELPEPDRDSILSGEFESQFEDYLGDSIGGRSFLTAASKQYDAVKGITPHTGAVISTDKDIGTGTTIKMTLLFVDDTVMEMYMKNSETEQMYIDALNGFAEKLSNEIRLYSMIVPTQLEFCPPMYKNLQDSQQDSINEIYAGLNPRFRTVDLCETLMEHSGEYIYLRSDHHWTPLGAYYAYGKFMETEGGGIVDMNNYKMREMKHVLGYLYDRVNTPGIAKTPDTIEWFEVDPNEHIDVVMHNTDDEGNLTDYEGFMYNRDKHGYSFFFGSDHPVVEMTNNDDPEGKTIVVIKDSYANAFAPWLIKSYHKVILVDPRIYKGNMEQIQEVFSPDEVLVMNYIFTTNFKDYCNMLKRLNK